MTRPPASVPPARSLPARPGGCLLSGLLLWLEAAIGVVIASLVAEKLAPPLAARGYNPNIGEGFLIAWGLGAISAVYPVLWIDRLRRRLTR